MAFDKKYKVYTWKNPLVLHWIINPGLAINELVFGQRIPKVSLEDRSSAKPLFERSFIPCPHCKTIHDSRIWSPEYHTAFKNWFGYFCPKCARVIPCHTNLGTLLILTLTYPLWVWFKKSLRERWLLNQPERFKDIPDILVSPAFSKQGWIVRGLRFGAFLFVPMVLLLPLLRGDILTWREVLIGLATWGVAGVTFSLFMRSYLNKEGGHPSPLIHD